MSTKTEKIYDQHIDLWTATVETHQSQLRRGNTWREHEFERKRNAALTVLSALNLYKQTVEGYPEPHPSEPEPFA